ncbi:Rossmann-fold NAD(P)-binding domain-containing protein [Pedobacter yulinensis]|uniref:hypothetical protein n=1 Tax=Pedobacter yulinensis TaxID=2126353 RepID=UPI001955144A|nr:hypothetical protein [Pedobacter yulinensis]
MNNKILVLGSTGKTGSRVYNLLKAGGHTAVPASRNSDIPFDWYERSTWAASLEGIHSVYITFQPDLSIPQALPLVTDFVNEAKAAGVSKLVLLSGRGEPECVACENVIINSGLDYTMLRCSFFMQNFSEGFWAEGIAAGELVIPVVHAKEPFIDTDDIAAVAVAALTSESHNGKIYELTGPELLDFSQTVMKIAAGSGHRVSLQQVSMDSYVDALKNLIPDDYIALIRYLFEEVLDGRNESVTTDVERVLGRPATTFDAFVSKAARNKAWTSNLQTA